MPELAAIYTTGFIFCFILTGVYVFLRERHRHSKSALNIQTNLAKLNLYWSDAADAIVPLTPTSSQDEASRSKRTIGYTGLILSLLSWLGAFFLLLIMLSERFFARSRRERNLFGSELSGNPSLEAREVQREISKLDLMNESPSETARPI